ncbi:hypothetical protein FLA_2543 [Filimonas lacunae]|nr:hypothetical protein FLA_2543 [Filimonas lacunae]
MHDYFNAHNGEIPASLKISPAETINNVRKLIDECFGILSDPSITERIKGMRVNLLKGIQVAMEKEKALGEA